MDAAFPNPLEYHRLDARTSAGSELMSKSRSVKSQKSLSEPEFARAVADALPQLVCVAKRLSGDDEIAAEAVQNALLKASKSWRRFRGDSQVNTWLTRIVIHCVRDAITIDTRRTNHCTVLPSEELETQSNYRSKNQGDPTRHVLDNEQQQAIRDAVRQLPHRQREVFSLVIWQSMKPTEVAELLEIETQNVHATMHAARKRLQTLLKKYFSED